MSDPRARNFSLSAGKGCQLSVVGLLLLVTAAYHNSFSGAFVFDDRPAIQENSTIRPSWTLGSALSPPQQSGVGGRPLANLSFAINHTLMGDDARGFHMGNLLLHMTCTLLLFEIVRRTLRLGGQSGCKSVGLALASAAVWSVHPLTTASVSYMSQRTELLMGFFYLLTLYAFIRSVTTEGRRWSFISVGACAFGMMSKEVMVTAPIIVWLYDRTFIAGTFRAAWQQRRRYYFALALTWAILGWLLTTGLEHRSVGYGLGVTAFEYALTEAKAILIYLRLAIIPHPLIFDYGAIYSGSLAVAFLILLLFGMAVRAMVRRSRIAFLVVSFFVLLAPTTSVVPVAEQPIAENRMYLPLAALTVMAMTAIGAAISTSKALDVQRIRTHEWLLVTLSVAALGTLTVRRNTDYWNEIDLWADTVRKRPENARAHFNHGVNLLAADRATDAVQSFQHAIRLKPRDAKSHNSLGNALLRLGRGEEATRYFSEAVRLDPLFAGAWYNYGTALMRQADPVGAIECFQHALRLQPGLARAHNALGNASFQLERPLDAITHYEAALRIDPSLADAHYSCGNACLDVGRVDDAIAHFLAATKLKPNDAEVRNNFGAALLRGGRGSDAITQFEHALRLKPDFADARKNLEIARNALLP